MKRQPVIVNPCPGCGKRFDFPLTGCFTMDLALLRKHSGNCPACGTKVLDEVEYPDPWDAIGDHTGITEVGIDKFYSVLSVRARNAIERRMGIRTVGDLLKYSASDIMSVGKVDQETVNELIETILKPKGLSLKEHGPPTPATYVVPLGQQPAADK
jgi:hypothetical protein